MAVTIESLGVSVSGQITRKHDPKADRTTISLNQGQAQELFDALGPVLQFFAQHNEAQAGDWGGNLAAVPQDISEAPDVEQLPMDGTPAKATAKV